MHSQKIMSKLKFYQENLLIYEKCLRLKTLLLEHLSHRSAVVFCKDQDSKNFRFCRPYGICCNYLTLPLDQEGSLSQNINEWTWLHSNRIWFTKTGVGLDLVYRGSYINPWSELRFCLFLFCKINDHTLIYSYINLYFYVCLNQDLPVFLSYVFLQVIIKLKDKNGTIQ